MAARVHRPLKVTAFDANDIWRQHYELHKQLQHLLDVALLSETHLKPHKSFFIPNYHFYWTDRFLGRKGGTTIAVRKGTPPQPRRPAPAYFNRRNRGLQTDWY
jgi:hypothetical protein